MEIMRREFRTSEDIALELAKEKVRRLKRFYNHLFIYIIGVLLFVAKRYYGAPLNFFPIKYLTETFMWCWTFVVGIQAMRWFFTERVFTTNWEEKQIQKELDKKQSTFNNN